MTTIKVTFHKNFIKTLTPDKEKLRFLPNGIVETETFGWDCGSARYDIFDKIGTYLIDMFNSAPDGEYIRCTNNRDEIKLIQSGELRSSVNHADNTCEGGLSVSKYYGYSDFGYKYYYTVSGKDLRNGSDGEPVMDLKTIIVKSKMRSAASTEEKLAISKTAKQDTWCNAVGWTREDMKAFYKANACEIKWDIANA